MKEMCLRWLYERDVLIELSAQVDEATVVDLATYAAGRADDLENASLNSDSHTVNKILKTYKKQMPLAQERLLDSSGQYALSYIAERVVVREHFQGCLKESHTVLADVLQLERKAVAQKAVENVEVVRCFESVPHKQQVVQRHARADAAKGHGELNVGPYVHKSWPEAMAILMLAVHVKAS